MLVWRNKTGPTLKAATHGATFCREEKFELLGDEDRGNMHKTFSINLLKGMAIRIPLWA